MNDPQKAFWLRAIQAFQTIVPDDDMQRYYLGRYMDDMKLPKLVIQKRYSKMWARAMDPDACFEDLLAVFSLEHLEARLGVEGCTQEAYDQIIAETIHGLITIALNNPEPSNVH